MKCLFCLILCCCLTNCMNSSRSEYDEIVDKISMQFARRICQNKKFRLSMVGGGIGGKISLGFDTVASLSIPEVRTLLVQKEEEFLALINRTPEIQPYLPCPSSAQTVSLEIGFFGSNGKFVKSPYIAFAYIEDGTTYYGVYEIKTDQLSTAVSEPYEEAYKVVYGLEKRFVTP